jgi:hypothetical protein
MSTSLHTSETKPNGFTKKCRDCDKFIYLHRGNSDRWRAFEHIGPPSDTSDKWVRHRCASGLQDAELMSLIAPAGLKPVDLIAKLKRVIADFEDLIEQAESRISTDGA